MAAIPGTTGDSALGVVSVTSPARLDMGYLTGWFLPQAHGNHKEARRLAAEYLEPLYGDKTHIPRARAREKAPGRDS